MRSVFAFHILFWLGLLGIAAAARAQAVSDDFADADLTQNPSWQGQTDQFAQFGGWLNLRGFSTGGRAAIVLPCSVQDSAVWRLTVRLDFAPSAFNRVSWVLASANGDFGASALTGYAIRLGQNGSRDGIDLVRLRQGTATLVHGWAPGVASTQPLLMLELHRGPAGWRLRADTAGLGVLSAMGGLVADTGRLFGTACGLVADYTSTNRNGAHFDNLSVTPGPANVPLARVVKGWCGGRFIRLETDRNLAPPAALTLSVDGQSQAATATLLGPRRMRLALEQPPVPGVPLSLRVAGLADSARNLLMEQSISLSCLPAAAALRLSELKVGSGSRAAGLPAAEFVELENQAAQRVWVEEATLTDATRQPRMLPADSLEPGERRVYCATAYAAAFAQAGIHATAMALPTLNDDGDQLSLRLGPGGPVADSVAYDPSLWLRTADVATLSLERGPDCLPGGRWHPSRAAFGASPGLADPYDASVDTSLAPRLMALRFEADSLHLYAKPQPPAGVNLSALSIRIEPGVALAGPWYLDDKGLHVRLGQAPDSAQAYTITLSGLPGCAGATLPRAQTLAWQLARAARPGAVAINELLYNPGTGVPAFVELHNPTARYTRLAGLRLAVASTDAEADTLSLPAAEPDLPPGGYRLLCQNLQALAGGYAKAQLSLASNLPLPRPDRSAGSLRLFSPEGMALDSLTYPPSGATPEPLRGQSLERVSPLLPTLAEGNWQPCPPAAGSATPGYRNSLAGDIASDVETDFGAMPQVLSPNGDGIDDQTRLDATGLPAGTRARLALYDAEGRAVRELVPAQLSPSRLSALWDGLLDNGRRATPGPYIALLELYHPSQKLSPRKCVVVVAP